MRNLLKNQAILISILFVSAAIGGCATGKPAVQAGPEENTNAADANTDADRVERFDVNRDKKADIWKYYTRVNGEEYLSRKELDLNNDGRIDLIRHFDSNGAKTKEILDMDFDGRIDCTIFYKDGRILRQELDLNYDGKIDLWKHFEQDKIIRIEMDKNYDGIIDYWEYYENEQLDRIGYDTDKDGKPDRVERRKLESDNQPSDEQQNSTEEEAGAADDEDDDDDDE